MNEVINEIIAEAEATVDSLCCQECFIYYAASYAKEIKERNLTGEALESQILYTLSNLDECKGDYHMNLARRLEEYI